MMNTTTGSSSSSSMPKLALYSNEYYQTTSSGVRVGVGAVNTNPDAAAAKKVGRLRVTVVSANDLPDREPPIYVQLDFVEPHPPKSNTNTNHNQNNQPEVTTTTTNNTNNRTSATLRDEAILKAVYRTGPPLQQHKDKNSFRFHCRSNNNNNTATGSNVSGSGTGMMMSSTMASTASTTTTTNSRGRLLVETVTLADLYHQYVSLTVVYANPNKPQYQTAPFPLHELVIHKPQWFVWDLFPNKSNDPPSPTVTTANPPTSLVAKGPAQQSSSSPSDEYDDSEDEITPPSLRLQMTLEGPYRPEIAALIYVFQGWFSIVDTIEYKLLDPIYDGMARRNLTLLSPWIWIPIVPLISLILAGTPIGIGAVVVTFPISVPLLVMILAMAMVLCGLGAVVYSSTKTGRAQVGSSVFRPLYATILQTPTGQGWIYETGPRPTPVHLLRSTVTPTGMWTKLCFSLGIDLVGSSSYLIPVVGEGMDFLWAPLQTALIMAMYCPDPSYYYSSSSSTNKTMTQTLSSLGWTILPYLSFLEEILMFTDVVPTATIGWLGEYAWPLVAQTLEPNHSPTSTNNKKNNNSSSSSAVLVTHK